MESIDHPIRSFKIVCRSSKLSLIQAGVFQRALQNLLPSAEIRIIEHTTAGDADKITPIYAMGDKNVFTKEIDQYLFEGKADFAVHSLKDLSAERMTRDARFCGAVLERNDPRDVAIFKEDVLQKLQSGKTIVLGASSLRRQFLIPSFLKKALPALHTGTPDVRFVSIRGNVDSRLRRLSDEKGKATKPDAGVDGIVIAAAGVNRLLSDPGTCEETRALLQNKKIMLLPLMECPPAPGQGALWAETSASNVEAGKILEQLNDRTLLAELLTERKYAAAFDAGCHQEFGVVSIVYKNTCLVNMAGRSNGSEVDAIYFDAPAGLEENNIFSATDYMKDFFVHRPVPVEPDRLNTGAVFVTHRRAVEQESVLLALPGKRLWAAGSKTWFELARLGCWVEGCADGYGLRFLDPVFASPLVNISRPELQILTNAGAAEGWEKVGFQTLSTYETYGGPSPAILKKVAQADVCFWTNFRQYEACKPFLKKNVLHLCPSGKTADLLAAEPVELFVFPTIKTWLYWRQKN